MSFPTVLVYRYTPTHLHRVIEALRRTGGSLGPLVVQLLARFEGGDAFAQATTPNGGVLFVERRDTVDVWFAMPNEAATALARALMAPTSAAPGAATFDELSARICAARERAPSR